MFRLFREIKWIDRLSGFIEIAVWLIESNPRIHPIIDHVLPGFF